MIDGSCDLIYAAWERSLDPGVFDTFCQVSATPQSRSFLLTFMADPSAS